MHKDIHNKQTNTKTSIYNTQYKHKHIKHTMNQQRAIETHRRVTFTNTHTIYNTNTQTQTQHK